MGIKESVPKGLDKLDKDNWKQVNDSDRQEYQIGSFTTFSNKMTK